MMGQIASRLRKVNLRWQKGRCEAGGETAPRPQTIISFVALSFSSGWSRSIRSMSHWSRVR